MYVDGNPVVWTDPTGNCPAVAAAPLLAVPGVGQVVLAAGAVAAIGAGGYYVATHPQEVADAVTSATEAISGAVGSAASAIGAIVGGGISAAKPQAPAVHPDTPKWQARGMPGPPADAQKIRGTPDYRVPKKGERWHPEPKHPLPKGPHWRVTDEKTGKWLRDVSMTCPI